MRPENSGAMCFINNDSSIEAFGDIDDLRKVGNCPVHAVDSVDHNEHVPTLISSPSERSFKAVQSVMSKHQHLPIALSTRIDDAGMVIAITEHQIVGLREARRKDGGGGEEREVRREFADHRKARKGVAAQGPRQHAGAGTEVASGTTVPQAEPHTGAERGRGIRWATGQRAVRRAV